MAAPTSAVFGVAGMVAPDRLVSQLGLEKFTCSSGYSLRTDVLRGGVRLEEGPFQVHFTRSYDGRHFMRLEPRALLLLSNSHLVGYTLEPHASGSPLLTLVMEDGCNPNLKHDSRHASVHGTTAETGTTAAAPHTSVLGQLADKLANHPSNPLHAIQGTAAQLPGAEIPLCLQTKLSQLLLSRAPGTPTRTTHTSQSPSQCSHDNSARLSDPHASGSQPPADATREPRIQTVTTAGHPNNTHAAASSGALHPWGMSRPTAEEGVGSGKRCEQLGVEQGPSDGLSGSNTGDVTLSPQPVDESHAVSQGNQAIVDSRPDTGDTDELLPSLDKLLLTVEQADTVMDGQPDPFEGPVPMLFDSEPVQAPQQVPQLARLQLTSVATHQTNEQASCLLAAVQSRLLYTSKARLSGLHQTCPPTALQQSTDNSLNSLSKGGSSPAATSSLHGGRPWSSTPEAQGFGQHEAQQETWGSGWNKMWPQSAEDTDVACQSGVSVRGQEGCDEGRVTVTLHDTSTSQLTECMRNAACPMPNPTSWPSAPPQTSSQHCRAVTRFLPLDADVAGTPNFDALAMPEVLHPAWQRALEGSSGYKSGPHKECDDPASSRLLPGWVEGGGTGKRSPVCHSPRKPPLASCPSVPDTVKGSELHDAVQAARMRAATWEAGFRRLTPDSASTQPHQPGPHSAGNQLSSMSFEEPPRSVSTPLQAQALTSPSSKRHGKLSNDLTELLGEVRVSGASTSASQVSVLSQHALAPPSSGTIRTWQVSMGEEHPGFQGHLAPQEPSPQKKLRLPGSANAFQPQWHAPCASPFGGYEGRPPLEPLSCGDGQAVSRQDAPRQMPSRTFSMPQDMQRAASAAQEGPPSHPSQSSQHTQHTQRPGAAQCGWGEGGACEVKPGFGSGVDLSGSGHGSTLHSMPTLNSHACTSYPALALLAGGGLRSGHDRGIQGFTTAAHLYTADAAAQIGDRLPPALTPISSDGGSGLPLGALSGRHGVMSRPGTGLSQGQPMSGDMSRLAPQLTPLPAPSSSHQHAPPPVYMPRQRPPQQQVPFVDVPPAEVAAGALDSYARHEASPAPFQTLVPSTSNNSMGSGNTRLLVVPPQESPPPQFMGSHVPTVVVPPPSYAPLAPPRLSDDNASSSQGRKQRGTAAHAAAMLRSWVVKK